MSDEYQDCQMMVSPREEEKEDQYFNDAFDNESQAACIARLHYLPELNMRTPITYDPDFFSPVPANEPSIDDTPIPTNVTTWAPMATASMENATVNDSSVPIDVTTWASMPTASIDHAAVDDTPVPINVTTWAPMPTASIDHAAVNDTPVTIDFTTWAPMPTASMENATVNDTPVTIDFTTWAPMPTASMENATVNDTPVPTGATTWAPMSTASTDNATVNDTFVPTNVTTWTPIPTASADDAAAVANSLDADASIVDSQDHAEEGYETEMDDSVSENEVDVSTQIANPPDSAPPQPSDPPATPSRQPYQPTPTNADLGYLTIKPTDGARAKIIKRELIKVSGVFSPSKASPDGNSSTHNPHPNAWAECRNCGHFFTKKDHMKNHFVGCVKKRGNPLTLHWYDIMVHPERKAKKGHEKKGE
ncbi:hypothetical protein ACLMJK_009592 [Lecanora helva]